MATVYYVEDDLDIAENVKTYLEVRQMEVSLFIVSLMRSKHC